MKPRIEPEFCYVAKAPCGHYVGAVTADPEDLESTTVETLKEWKAGGLTIEQKPVSFVRKGGLTFCDCRSVVTPTAHRRKLTL